MLASLSPCSMKISVQQIRKKHTYIFEINSNNCNSMPKSVQWIFYLHFMQLPFAFCHLQFCHFSIWPFAVCAFCRRIYECLHFCCCLLALNLQLFAATAAQVQHIFVIINFKLASVNLNRTRHLYSPHLPHSKASSSSLLYCYLETWQAQALLPK